MVVLVLRTWHENYVKWTIGCGLILWTTNPDCPRKQHAWTVTLAAFSFHLPKAQSYVATTLTREIPSSPIQRLTFSTDPELSDRATSSEYISEQKIWRERREREWRFCRRRTKASFFPSVCWVIIISFLLERVKERKKVSSESVITPLKEILCWFFLISYILLLCCCCCCWRLQSVSKLNIFFWRLCSVHVLMIAWSGI